MKPRKKIPTFKDQGAEREFWANEDSTQYIDWSQGQSLVLPNLRPTSRTISRNKEESTEKSATQTPTSRKRPG